MHAHVLSPHISRTTPWVAAMALGALTLLAGCRQQPLAELSLPVPKLPSHNGLVVLGTADLLAGIPGSGPLTVPQIKAWLDTPGVCEPLPFTLPDHLADASEEIAVPEDNPLTWAKIELGRQLFFDKRLSGIGTFACATCHHPSQWFTGYMVMPEVGRNASTVFNRILGREHFWDGRAQGLEAQPQSPIENPFEMNSTPETTTAHIQAVEGYRVQFERIFGGVSFQAICQALASFERAIVTPAAPWDRGELTAAANRGQELFYSERLQCGNCHSGKNLTDEDYHRLGANRLRSYNDQGRFAVTQDPRDRFAYKTPSLRNVAVTAPYMHNGAVGTLEEVVEFFDAGGHAEATESAITPLKLTEQEKVDLIAFLASLTSEPLAIETGRLPE